MTQNQEYLLLLGRRLKEPKLIWVGQFVEIINKWVEERGFNSGILINDFGCNVGHFYRGAQDIIVPVDYCGYDISDTYLKIAKDNFTEAKFLNFDIAGPIAPRSADVSVISATLEHIDNHLLAMRNIFDASEHLVILRTFIGDSYASDSCLTDGASDEYLIKQFTFESLVSYPKEIGWNACLVTDKATEGRPKFVCNGRTIMRSQKILIFTRNGK